MALSSYDLVCPSNSSKPIWAVAENYRFEPGFIEVQAIQLCLYTISFLGSFAPILELTGCAGQEASRRNRRYDECPSYRGRIS